MMLDSGWVAAIASIASAIVVVFAAVASFRQITHFRNANDIAVYMKLVEELYKPEHFETLQRLGAIRDAVASDPELRRLLRQPGYAVHPAYEGAGPLLRFLEYFATLIIFGGIAEELVLAQYADNFVSWWDDMREIIYLRREGLGPYLGSAFEDLAMRSKKYIESGRMAREYDRLQRDPEMVRLFARQS